MPPKPCWPPVILPVAGNQAGTGLARQVCEERGKRPNSGFAALFPRFPRNLSPSIKPSDSGLIVGLDVLDIELDGGQAVERVLLQVVADVERMPFLDLVVGFALLESDAVDGIGAGVGLEEGEFEVVVFQ